MPSTSAPFAYLGAMKKRISTHPEERVGWISITPKFAVNRCRTFAYWIFPVFIRWDFHPSSERNSRMCPLLWISLLREFNAPNRACRMLLTSLLVEYIGLDFRTRRPPEGCWLPRPPIASRMRWGRGRSDKTCNASIELLRSDELFSSIKNWILFWWSLLFLFFFCCWFFVEGRINYMRSKKLELSERGIKRAILMDCIRRKIDW